MMSKNIIKTLFMGMRQKIDMSVVLDLKMKKLKESFDLPTTYDNCNALLKTLLRRKRDLIKYRCANQAMNYAVCEQAFIAMHKKIFGGVKKARKIFTQKEETTQMMRSPPKSKKKRKQWYYQRSCSVTDSQRRTGMGFSH